MSKINLKKNSDYQLWEDFKHGDQNALTTIYQGNYKILYNYGLKLHRSSDLVKDTIQEIFIDLLNNIETIGDTDNIKLYLITTFRNKFFKKVSRNKEIPADVLPSNGDDFDVSTEESIIQSDNQEEYTKALKIMLQKISPRQREIIHLKFIMELSYDEISEIMNINYQSARQLLYDAMKAMRKVKSEVSL